MDFPNSISLLALAKEKNRTLLSFKNIKRLHKEIQTVIKRILFYKEVFELQR